MKTFKPGGVHPAENKITEKSIKDLEDEKEYQGDDPIVRQRLGLPPKESP